MMKSSYIKSIIALLPALILTITGSVLAGSVDQAAKTYEKKMAEIDGIHASKLKKAAGIYSRKISSFLARSRKSGDLEATLAARKEKQRFNREKSVPKELPADIEPVIAVAQSNYHKSLAAAETERHESVLKLSRQYIEYLESLKKKMVRLNKLKEAIRIKKIMEKVRSSPRIAAAEFAVADAASAEESAEENAEPEYEIIKYDKKVRAKGNLAQNWTATTLRLEEGDLVTVKARGTWQCTYHRGMTGPEGYSYSTSRSSKYRRSAAANYGALILKCGSKGEIMPVGSELTFTSKDGGVLIFLDANVMPGRIHRKDCSGHMIVDITVKRRKK